MESFREDTFSSWLVAVYGIQEGGMKVGDKGFFTVYIRSKPDLSWPVLRLELALETNFKEAFQRTARVFC